MKTAIRFVFKPLLTPLENFEGPFVYKPSHRTILIVVSFMFLMLGAVSLVLAPSVSYMLPVVLFGGVGIAGIVVGCVGKDVAVARLWGSKGSV